MGVFCTVSPESAKGWEIETCKTAKPVETGRDDGSVSVLFAHIVGTKCRGEVITDDDMDYRRDFRTAKSSSGSKVGHQLDGRTAAIHSLAVHPKLQGCGLGKLIMKAYMQQINNSGTADRISLIAQSVSPAVPIQERLCFGDSSLLTLIFLVSGKLLYPVWLCTHRREQSHLRRRRLA